MFLQGVAPCTRSLMDRTEASDAFNAGSIPVGCILHHPTVVHEFIERLSYVKRKNEADGGLSGEKQ